MHIYKNKLGETSLKIDIEGLLKRYFAEVRRNCIIQDNDPDSLNLLLTYHSGVLKNPGWVEHIENCVACQFRLLQIKLIEEIINRDDPEAKKLAAQIDEKKILAAILKKLKEESSGS